MRGRPQGPPETPLGKYHDFHRRSPWISCRSSTLWHRSRRCRWAEKIKKDAVSSTCYNCSSSPSFLHQPQIHISNLNIVKSTFRGVYSSMCDKTTTTVIVMSLSIIFWFTSCPFIMCLSLPSLLFRLALVYFSLSYISFHFRIRYNSAHEKLIVFFLE